MSNLTEQQIMELVPSLVAMSGHDLVGLFALVAKVIIQRTYGDDLADESQRHLLELARQVVEAYDRLPI